MKKRTYIVALVVVFMMSLFPTSAFGADFPGVTTWDDFAAGFVDEGDAVNTIALGDGLVGETQITVPDGLTVNVTGTGTYDGFPTALAGEAVKLVFAPDKGYETAWFSVNGKNIVLADKGFAMPRGGALLGVAFKTVGSPHTGDAPTEVYAAGGLALAALGILALALIKRRIRYIA